MFSYYGSKSKMVEKYLSPLHRKIIEPFAGSARYALRHYKNEVLLVDKNKDIIDVWHYLQSATPNEIMSLPDFEAGDLLDNFDFKNRGQRLLVGYMTAQGRAYSGNKVSSWGVRRLTQNKTRIANNLWKIKHWDIVRDDYRNIPNQVVTWFVDPPYQVGGHKYKHGNKGFDYKSLRAWCESRYGSVIITENTNSGWWDFEPVAMMRGQNNITTEAVKYLGDGFAIQERLL